MIIQLSSSAPPKLIDAERTDRLHAVLPAGGLPALFDDRLCARGPDADHVWVGVAALRSAVLAAVEDEAIGERFDQTIAYARSKGWLDDTEQRVRAHIEG